METIAKKKNTNFVTNKIQHKQENAPYEIIVFSHLRWDFVYQRPQHIVSRLAKDHKILFVEEPIGYEEGTKDTIELRQINSNLTIFRAKTDTIDTLIKILADYTSHQIIETAWFYSPSFVGVLDEIDFGSVIFDCMDELTLFKNAPLELIKQEKVLLSKATIVFTGGKSLYNEKVKHHKNVYCFPSSVERKHFEQALNGISVANDMDKFEGTVVGYYGVIDERIDFELLGQTALLHQDIDFVMIGPLAKISHADLPSLPNIHFLGMRTYAELPSYLKRFNIAMMPFALNEATRFISPTKTLEYMAAGKHIISTPIYDVVRDYSDFIEIVENATDFSAAISRILNIGETNNYENYEEILDKTSWDATVKHMQILMLQLAY